MELIDVVKEIVERYVNNSKVSEAVIAVYTGDGLSLDGREGAIALSNVTLPRGLTDHELTVEREGEEVVLRVKSALEVGERVSMIRNPGAGGYVLLDRVATKEG